MQGGREGRKVGGMTGGKEAGSEGGNIYFFQLSSLSPSDRFYYRVPLDHKDPRVSEVCPDPR